jgi:predicted GNAT family acetyltransferase
MTDTGSTGNTAIIDNTAQSRFELQADGHLAELIYRQVGRRLVLVHTRVPGELGGRGIGGQLVQAALSKATAGGLTVVPLCPFARSWLERHPDEAATVTIDWKAS